MIDAVTAFEQCETCMTAIARWVADARRGAASNAEWRDLADLVLRRARVVDGSHLAIPHPPTLPPSYTSLGEPFLIDTYEHALEELSHYVH